MLVEYIQNLPHRRIVQMHLAGHTNCRTHLLDTHDNHVIDPVWELYRLAHRLTGGVSSLLEWDAKIPPFPVVHAEVLKAREYMAAELNPHRKSVCEAPPHPSSFDTAHDRPFPGREGERHTPPHPTTLVARGD